MNYYEKAMELKEETIANRRYIHKNAETGLDLPRTKAFVMEKPLRVLPVQKLMHVVMIFTQLCF